MFEKQPARKAFVQFQAYGGSRSTQVSTQGRPTTNSAPFKIESAGLPSISGAAKPVPKATQSFTFKCYKCGEAGHKATYCKKAGVGAQGKGKALMIEGCEYPEDEEFSRYEEGIFIGDSDEERRIGFGNEKDPVSTKTGVVGGLVEEQHFSHHL